MTIKQEIIAIEKQTAEIHEIGEEIKAECKYWDKKIQEVLL